MKNIKNSALRNAIITEAKDWLHTEFKHQGRLKQNKPLHNGGCDCLGLIIGIAKTLNLKNIYSMPLTSLDKANYPRIFNGNHVYKILKYNFIEIDIKNIKSGDLILLKIRNNPQHIAVYNKENNSIIHADTKHNKVIEEKITSHIENKFYAAFSLLNEIY